MATDVQQETGAAVSPYRLTVRQFARMIDAGVFPDGARVELLGGVLVGTMTKNEPHDFAVDQLGAILGGMLGPGWIARQEKSVVLGRYWRPEPDIAVARGPRDRYRARAPRAGDLALVIEVADTTYAGDRGLKWRRYAGAGIPACWIVNIPRRQVEVYGAPSGRGKAASYRDAATYRDGDEVPLVIDGREVGRVGVTGLLP